ncbi:hypothetical protein NVV93_12540 [Pseudomonas sp. LS44]|uniref:tetratricopeptide repeat protein n=1 Tax=Pseudomonas sp. LS44 TaxID=1357074 RepID=UPI00215A2340|nr:hypothetical protein [Pseudomonas sp. LS44]UVE16439.1 hypothetical protein NVV93_12540 [Pseudomonas sp. LS44]
MSKSVVVCLLAAALCAGCASNFKPLRGEPAVVAANRPAPPEAPVYGVASYEPPQVWLAPLAKPDEVQGKARSVQRLPEPGQELLLKAGESVAAGDQPGMLRLLQAAADAGNSTAHYELARIYQTGQDQTGQGVTVDLPAALSHLSLADAMGNPEATRVLAWNYLLGTGLSADVAYGTRLMEKAARRNDRALRELSLLYLNVYAPGLNDSARGLELLQLASDAGDLQAERLYRQHQQATAAPGVAAEQPYGAELAPGLVSIADAEAHADETKRAALSGDLQSMSRYAENVLQGQFPSLQPELESYAWFAVAAKRGSAPAAERIAALEPVRQANAGQIEALVADLDSAIAAPVPALE